jgi:hypothetical protein
MTTPLQTAARAALAVMFIVVTIGALLRHGKTEPTQRLHAAPLVLGTAVEAALVWLAGGFG